MTKQFLPKSRWLVTIILLTTLCISQMWGTETLVYTLDGTKTGGTNAFAEESDIDQSSKAWKVKGNTTQNPWRIGGKKLISATERSIYNITSSLTSDDISMVVLSNGAFSDASKISVSSVKLIVSTSSNGGGTKTSELSRSFKASDTIQFRRPNGVSWANKYFTIVYTITTDNTNTNRYFTFNYAKFYKNTYTVSYNSNGGSGTMTDSSSPYNEGATVTVKSNSFTAPTGKTFDHWDTKSDDSGTDYAAGATFSIADNTTLYAQWATAASCTATPSIGAASLKGSVF